jgi:hypothetical protein
LLSWLGWITLGDAAQYCIPSDLGRDHAKVHGCQRGVINLICRDGVENIAIVLGGERLDRTSLFSVNYFSRSTTTRIPDTYLPFFLCLLSSKVSLFAPGPRLWERTLKKDAKPPCPLLEAGSRSEPALPWSP